MIVTIYRSGRDSETFTNIDSIAGSGDSLLLRHESDDAGSDGYELTDFDKFSVTRDE